MHTVDLAVRFEESGVVAAGHEGLLFPHPGEQILLAAIIQLAEHIVQQQHRVFARDGGSCGGFGHFKAEHDAPLLSLTRIHFCRLTIQKKV